MPTSYYKEPAPPTGGDPIATYLRQFHQWSKQFLVRGVKGAKTKPDPNGGLHIIIPPTVVPPVPPQTFTNYYPFKIYKYVAPLTALIGTKQPMLQSFSQDGVLVLATVTDAKTPSNLLANPPTVSIADGWRFWAVRSGYVEARPIYSALPSLDNFAYFITPKYTDCFIGDFDESAYAGNTPETQPKDLVLSGPPTAIILGTDTDPFGSITAMIWIEVIPDTPTSIFPSAILRGFAEGGTPDDVEDFIVSNNGDIPVGFIYANNQGQTYGALGSAGACNFIFDHARNRFPPGNGNFGPLTGTVENIRGRVNGQFSASGGAFLDPNDLDDQIYYPGDKIYIEGWGIGLAANLPAYTGVYEFVGPFPAFLMNLLSTADYLNAATPFDGDSNWKLVSWAIQASPGDGLLPPDGEYP